MKNPSSTNRLLKPKYKAPQIVDLEDPRLGAGFCSVGSGDPATCDTGNSALGFGGCQSNGNSASFCFNGNTPEPI